MLTRTLRERIGGLIRDGSLSGGEPHPDRAAVPPRHYVSIGIEEILPGGVIETAHGTVFAHERLYTELGERPIPLIRRLAELCTYPGCEPRSEEAPRFVEIPGVDIPYPAAWARTRRRLAGGRPRRRPRRRPRDLAEATGLHDPPERGLFRRFGYRKALYMDIETCALTSSPVFLVGLCMVGERNLVLRQLFARDYAEERALLAEVARLAEEHDFLVTFNGKTFDVPYLRDRAIHHRLGIAFQKPHLDLLWMARRRWKEALPDCRLKTIEWRVLRRRRAGDVGSAEIPGLYHDYVKRGEAHRLLPVFHHNLLDVVAMVELTPVIFDPDVTVY